MIGFPPVAHETATVQDLPKIMPPMTFLAVGRAQDPLVIPLKAHLALDTKARGQHSAAADWKARERIVPQLEAVLDIALLLQLESVLDIAPEMLVERLIMLAVLQIRQQKVEFDVLVTLLGLVVMARGLA